MKLIRKFVLTASLALTAIFHACNPAIAKDEERATYTYMLDDGEVLFTMLSCTDLASIAAVPEAYKQKLKVAVAIPKDPREARLPLCWAEIPGALVIVIPNGNHMVIQLTDERVVKHTRI